MWDDYSNTLIILEKALSRPSDFCLGLGGSASVPIMPKPGGLVAITPLPSLPIPASIRQGGYLLNPQ
jgi:hypothetical protein